MSSDGSINSRNTKVLILMQSLSRYLSLNNPSGLWFILTQQSMGKMSMVNRSLIDFHFFEALNGAFEVLFFSGLHFHTLSKTLIACRPCSWPIQSRPRIICRIFAHFREFREYSRIFAKIRENSRFFFFFFFPSPFSPLIYA